MEILTALLQIGTHNMGFSAQFPAKKGPGNLTPSQLQVEKLLGLFMMFSRNLS